MRRRNAVGRLGRAVTAAAVLTAMGLAAQPAIAQPAAAPPAKAAPAAGPAAGQGCAAADLGKRHPFIKTTEVSPTITHFKGWYVTEGTTGTHTVSTSTQTVIAVSVGVNGNVEGGFGSEVLGKVGASLGLNVKVDYTSTSEVSDSIVWNFVQPGYYGLYKGTKKVTGTYGSLHCNRVQQGGGSYTLQWVKGSDSGSYTTYTTLEEGAVRCEDSVPAHSIMAKAQTLLDCGSATATAEHAAGPVPSAKAKAKATAARHTAGSATEATRSAKAGPATAATARAALTCGTDVYKIAVPGKPLSFGAPLLANDGVRLRPSTIFSAHLDHWRLCDVTENNGVLEATLWNWGNGGCATIAPQNPATERAVLMTAACAEDDLQRFYVYRDVPGSGKIGLQNKYTGSMIGHDRYADGEFLRQYSSGRQDGTGTYDLVKV